MTKLLKRLFVRTRRTSPYPGSGTPMEAASSTSQSLREYLEERGVPEDTSRYAGNKGLIELRFNLGSALRRQKDRSSGESENETP